MKHSRHVIRAVLALLLVLFLAGCIQFPSTGGGGQDQSRDVQQEPGPSPAPQPTPQAVPSDSTDRNRQPAPPPAQEGTETQTQSPDTYADQPPNLLEEECAPSGCTTFQEAPAGAAPPSSGARQNAPSYTVQEYLQAVIDDLAAKWQPWFAEKGLENPFVYYRLVSPGDPSFVSNCSGFSGEVLNVHDSYPNAFYCSQDPYVGTSSVENGTLILPVTTFQKMWTGEVAGGQSQFPGDFAAAIVTAHEFGHHVQDELEVQLRPQNPTVNWDFNPASDKEAIADCFAGNWMYTAYYDGLLEDGDFNEAVSALTALGAPAEGGTHPTAAQRQEALLLGYLGNSEYTAGDPMACIERYW